MKWSTPVGNQSSDDLSTIYLDTSFGIGFTDGLGSLSFAYNTLRYLRIQPILPGFPFLILNIFL